MGSRILSVFENPGKRWRSFVSCASAGGALTQYRLARRTGKNCPVISFNWRRVASTLFGLLLFASSARAVSNYTLIDLGLPPGAVDVSVEAVNTNGIVVGNILMSGGLPRGFVYQNGSITLLTLPSGADRSVARGINGAGQVVGTATFGSDSRAILWT